MKITKLSIYDFLKITISSWLEELQYLTERAYWAFKYRFIPKYKYNYIRTGLKPGYYDKPTTMLHGLFYLLVDYVEKEKCFEVINWDSDILHKCVAGEIEDLYEWWLYQRPKALKRQDDLYDQVSNHFLGKPTEQDIKIYDKLYLLEIELDKLDIYNLKRLVSIKNFLWT